MNHYLLRPSLHQILERFCQASSRYYLSTGILFTCRFIDHPSLENAREWRYFKNNRVKLRLCRGRQTGQTQTAHQQQLLSKAQNIIKKSKELSGKILSFSLIKTLSKS